MTTNMIPPTLTLAALPLGAVPALAMPPSGDLPIPPDFALALAELVAAPADVAPRPALAAPGNALPVKLADAGAVPLAGALLHEEVLTVPEGENAKSAGAGKPKEAVDDDATLDPGLDPALSWLIAPPPAPPVVTAAAIPPIPIPVQAASPDPVEITAGTTKQPAIATVSPETVAEPAVAQATAQDPAAIPVPQKSDRIPLAGEPRAKPHPVAVPDQIIPAPLPSPTAAAATPAAEPVIVLPKRPASSERTTLQIDPKLAKVIAAAPVITVALPLPVAPPRFVEARITPTVVAAAVVAPATIAALAPITSALPTETAVTEDAESTTPVPIPERVAPPVREKAPETTIAAAVRPAAAPALQPAAPALAAIGAAAPRPLPRPIELRPLAETTASLFAAALTQAVTTPTAVQPTVDAQSPGMDLTRDTGLERMIDRIEMLRDDADSRDTRIRLIPDALGPVEVSVRRDGDSVRVHFTADQPATRALIADAQPRLTELAEARGVRISQASVDIGTGSGSAGDGRARPQPQQEARLPNAPRRATTETSESGDERIA